MAVTFTAIHILWKELCASLQYVTTMATLSLTGRMASSGTLRRVAVVRADVSEELSASIIRVTRIGELGTTLAVTSNRRTLCIASPASYG
jgi:hypothetical protein